LTAVYDMKDAFPQKERDTIRALDQGSLEFVKGRVAAEMSLQETQRIHMTQRFQALFEELGLMFPVVFKFRAVAQQHQQWK